MPPAHGAAAALAYSRKVPQPSRTAGNNWAPPGTWTAPRPGEIPVICITATWLTQRRLATLQKRPPGATPRAHSQFEL